MIAQTIQLALAPVFVLVAIGNIMNILTSRLARVVDRSRTLLARYDETEGKDHDELVIEIRQMDRRITLIGGALRLLVLSGLTIGLTVAILFSQNFTSADLELVAAAAFLLAIALLMWALLLFLRETQVAANALKIPEMFLEKGRKL